MKFRETPVRVIRVEAECDTLDCQGTYRPTGVVYSCYPEQFVHECTHCGKSITFTTTYPKIAYKNQDIDL